MSQVGSDWPGTHGPLRAAREACGRANAAAAVAAAMRSLVRLITSPEPTYASKVPPLERVGAGRVAPGAARDCDARERPQPPRPAGVAQQRAVQAGVLRQPGVGAR